MRLAFRLRQSRDHLPQRHQTFIDLDALLARNVPRLFHLLTASQIDQLQSRNNHIIRRLSIDTLQRQLQHGVRPTTRMIHVMRGDYLVFHAEVE